MPYIIGKDNINNIEGRANYKKFYEFIRRIKKRELFKEISKDYIW